MRRSIIIALVCVGLLPVPAVPAWAQATPNAGAVPLSPRETYAAMTLAERVAIQSDLVWTGHYDGIIDGDFGDRSLAAVQAFQKANKRTETGILNPHERRQLSSQARARQEQVGWHTVDDSATGVTMGLPAKLVPQASRVKDGTRWASKDGDIRIETFRFSGPAVTLASVKTQLRAVAERKVDYDTQRAEFFVMSGAQGTKKFYIRAHTQGQEVRGFTVLYETAKDATMAPVAVAMSNAFAPFSGRGTIQVGGTVARRKVEYTTGLIASAAGHVLADRQATDGCQVIQIPRLGPAERVADDAASGIALLRVYGAGDLHPAALAGEAGSGNAATLVGIADPRVQNGGAAVTTPSARLSGTGAPRTIEPPPPLGFSGAAAVDRRGRLLGVVLQQPQRVAGPAADTKAVLVPVEAVGKFLRDHDVMPASGAATTKQLRASAVRVICVRS